MIRRLNIIIVYLFLSLSCFCQASLHPFWEDIQAFKKQDNIAIPPKNRILFIGSSSFTLWKDVQEYFPDYKILNRAFGGSTLKDLIFYYKDIIVPYQPKQIVIYCGENDIATSKEITGKIVFQRFRQLYDSIRAYSANVPIVYVSMKPSPSRWHLRKKMKNGNKRIRKFCNKTSTAIFVSVWKDMLKNGKPRSDIFLDDNLHMNKKGYLIWQKRLSPVLKKE